MKKILYLLFCTFLILLGVSQGTHAQTISSHYEYVGCGYSDSMAVYTTAFASGQTIKTYYGDGSSDVNPVVSYFAGNGVAWFAHNYTASGTYTVKEILYSGGVPVDSVTFSIVYTFCEDMTFILYNDINSNCINDAPDMNIPAAAVVEVDSAGVPVDTITSGWWGHYVAYGPMGTIYTFRVITPPHGFLTTCPSSGIIHDTADFSYAPHYIGFECDPGACLDNAISGYFSAGVTGAGSVMFVTSSSCSAVSVTVKLTFSPKYTLATALGGASHSVSGNVLTYNISSVSASSPVWLYAGFNPATTLTLGDTVHTKFALTPTSGDCDTTNNLIVAVDTIRSSYDPNHKSVQPVAGITAGAKLQYTLAFENTGNAVAQNIHLMDTLSDNLDISTIKLVSSSAKVTMILLTYGTHNIVKFDFPNINLPDSSHHGLADGMVVFNINAKTGLAIGTHIDNRAGIYFDDNDVVMTNTVENIIGTPTSVSVLSNTTQVAVFPNPANDELTINTAKGAYHALTITNTFGQIIMSLPVTSEHTKVNVSVLPAGIYIMTLKGADGVKVQKFEKL
jgi:uncharacterized repeat protein (TIGR01451 family)